MKRYLDKYLTYTNLVIFFIISIIGINLILYHSLESAAFKTWLSINLVDMCIKDLIKAIMIGVGLPFFAISIFFRK